MRVRIARIPLAAVAAFISVGALVGGCTGKADPATTPSGAPGGGVAAQSAEEILTKAKAALAGAKSFHAKGPTTEEVDATKIDLKFSGGDIAGTIESTGLLVDVIAIGNDLYMKAPDAFWASFIPPDQQAALTLIKGKYVKVDSTMEAVAGFKDLFKPDDLIEADGTYAKGEAKTVNGVPAIGLVDSKDKSVLYVATEGEPFPLKSGAAGGAGLDFTEYNATFDIKAPAAADVLDLKAVTGA